MEQDQLLPVPDNLDDVDTTVPPSSAEHYLAQVIAGRRKCDEVARASNVRRVAPPTSSSSTETDAVFSSTTVFASTVTSSSTSRSAFAPSEEWIQAKVAAFVANRDRITQCRASFPKTPVEWPVLSDSEAEAWVAQALERCAPEASGLCANFPNHSGTPPSLSVLAAMSTAQVHHLICVLIDYWLDVSVPSSPPPSLTAPPPSTRAILEWIHALLLFVDLPIMPDVCSYLRAFVNSIRKLRTTETDESIRLQYSLFIGLTAHTFGQKDLAD